YFCAWAREVWHLLRDDRSREAVLAAERFADGLVGPRELLSAHNAAQEGCRDVRVEFDARRGKRRESQKGTHASKNGAEDARNAASRFLNVRVARPTLRVERAARRVALCAILRDLFGRSLSQPPAIEPGWLTWNEATVGRVATAIYQEGTFEEMPVLADALEDAGCQHEEILFHCRRPEQVHVRGCWVLDALLGNM